MQKGIHYTGVCVVYLCHDGKGNYLLSKRSKNARDEHGRWDPGGGAIEFGEKIENALKREVKEEYSTDALDFEFLGFLDAHREDKGKKTHWIALNFKVLVDKNKVKIGEPEKIEEIAWFRLDNLPKPLHSQFPDFLKNFRGKL